MTRSVSGSWAKALIPVEVSAKLNLTEFSDHRRAWSGRQALGSCGVPSAGTARFLAWLPSLLPYRQSQAFTMPLAGGTGGTGG